MADTVFTSQTPATVQSDTTARNLGVRFQCNTSGRQVAGGRVWVAATGLADVDLWQVWDEVAGTKILEYDMHNVTPTLGGWTTVPAIPATTAALTASNNYIVCHYQNGPGTFDFVYTSPGGYPIGSGGTISASIGVYRNNGTSNEMPNSTFDSYHFADVNVVEPGVSATINLATETDSAFAFTAANVTPLVLAVERDSAFAFTPSVGPFNGTIQLAFERDVAFPFSSTGGGGLTLDADLSVTYYLNAMADTLVNGVPTLTAAAAAKVWAGVAADFTEVGAYNTEAGNVLPQWRALQGVLNQIAGTTDLSVHDALKAIAAQ